MQIYASEKKWILGKIYERIILYKVLLYKVYCNYKNILFVEGLAF